MATFLFDKIIFGPVQSRRLGVSLGINLLPTDYKFCNFDCIYCECGYTFPEKFRKHPFHSRAEVRTELEKVLLKMQSDNNLPNYISFAGNGEPTLHPEFSEIISDTVELRNRIAPQAKIAVLSNATQAHKPAVREALLKADDCILKLDSGIDDTMQRMNGVSKSFTVEKIIEALKQFEGKAIIQTMFLKGCYNDIYIDNTTETEIETWLGAMRQIAPRKIMIYTIDRETPAAGLEKISAQKLNEIADRARHVGFDVQVSV